MTLTLNIVYTPGTVSMLSFMVDSLLHWSDCSFCLVSNACLPPEERFLQKRAENHPRLIFYPLPTTKVWPHGKVLNHLHDRCMDDYFGFMDSDIFATGEFLPDMIAITSEHAAVFTGAPVWAKTADQVMPSGFQLMSGPYNRMASGIHIGSTYFAIYNNQTITDLRRKTDIGFDEASWHDVPHAWQDILADAGLDKQSYDTGKLLNAMLIAQDHTLRYVDTPNLTHLGGTSFVPLAARPKRWWADLPGASTLRRWRAERAMHSRFARNKLDEAEIQAEATLRLAQRNVMRQYFWTLLQTLNTGRSLPPIPTIDDQEIKQALISATEALIATYRQFADNRSGTLFSAQPATGQVVS